MHRQVTCLKPSMSTSMILTVLWPCPTASVHLPPTLAHSERYLTTTPSVIRLVLLVRPSVNERGLYDYLIINDNLDDAVEKLKAIAARALAGLEPEPGKVPESVLIEDVSVARDEQAGGGGVAFLARARQGGGRLSNMCHGPVAWGALARLCAAFSPSGWSRSGWVRAR